MNTKEFINKAKEIHSNKYDYSLVDYEKSYKNIQIICPIHGIFEQTSNSHFRNNGCKKCTSETKKINKTSNNIEFINKAIDKHGNIYNYSLVDYVNSITLVKIICKKHGEFEQTPTKHLLGRGCRICGNEKNTLKQRISSEDFINKANKVHKNKYDYSLIEYINVKTKIKIICKKHGEFEQIPNVHLSGCGCPKCKGKMYNFDKIVNQFKEIHRNKYDYSLMNYDGMHKKIKIICKKHGEFEQTPIKHKKGGECPICSNTETINTETIINKFKEIHGDKYNYTKFEYIKSRHKSIIICSIHGEFKQNSNNHLQGKGCRFCNTAGNVSEYKLYDLIKKEFSKYNIISQGKEKWLKTKKTSTMSLDIYFPNEKIAIEYQGVQHFRPVDFFGGEKSFLENKNRDINKYNLCLKHNITLLYFSYNKKDIPIDYPYKVYFNEDELIKQLYKILT